MAAGEKRDRKTKRPPIAQGPFVLYSRRRPTLPRSFPRSTIGAVGLNFRVRNGNGCFPHAKATGKISQLYQSVIGRLPKLHAGAEKILWSSLTGISTGRLSTLPHLHPQPINLVVYQGPTVLSEGKPHLGEGFALRCFQRLSNRRSLPSTAPGGTTGTQELRLSWSSRTKDGTPQVSSARNR
jgi:hypothetical protein